MNRAGTTACPKAFGFAHARPDTLDGRFERSQSVCVMLLGFLAKLTDSETF